MRIIAGQLKGRRLAGPDGPGLRPTSDGLRETLFNILGTSASGARVLDGFAGTGALGLEAVSRGAAHVTFVELDPRALRLLRQNIRTCGVEAACTVVGREFRLWAGQPGSDGAGPGPFDLVLLDPPYDEKDLDAIVTAAAANVAPGGRLVLEHSRRRESLEAAGTLRRTRVVIAGDSALSFYQES